MLSELTQNQIEELLHDAQVGRIGCSTGERTYIVPVYYAYDGNAIYAHSIDGMKIQIMRANPNVCFQVDQIKNLSNWRSIIAWGTFEELANEEAASALHFIAQHLSMSIAGGFSLHEMRRHDPLQRKMVVYRIRLHEKTGRYERTPEC